MSQDMLDTLKSRIAAGLQRQAITKCSEYAELYRVMGMPFSGPWTFNHHPWTREMHDCTEELVIGQKAAQMGFTEIALNKSFFEIDINGVSVLYVLPAATPDASDFSTSRFDPALEMSPRLQAMFSNVKNIGHKRAGNANLFIRGSRSRSQLKSLPVGLMIFDEVDEMYQKNIPLAFERMSGQLFHQAYMISTPTIDRYGINEYYRNSTQEHFFFKCPSCSRLTELIFPECLVITADEIIDLKIRDSHLICKECKNTLHHESKIKWLEKGQWIKGHTDRPTRGFTISQLYSMTVKPYELALGYLKSLTNPADEQEFNNSKLGKTHEVKGARVLDENITACIGAFKSVESIDLNNFVTIGIDVGKWIHYEIDQWFFDPKMKTNDINLLAKCKVLKVGKVLHFEDLDNIMRQYWINFGVIDAHPEKRKSKEFADRFWGHIKLCFYGRGVNSKQIHVHSDEEQTITVDRTSWLDLSLGRFKRKAISLPVDIPLEYKEHIKALVRIYEKDADGNPIGKYVKGNEDDHYAHARTYSEMALPLSLDLAIVQNVKDVY